MWTLVAALPLLKRLFQLRLLRHKRVLARVGPSGGGTVFLVGWLTPGVGQAVARTAE